MDRRRRPPGGFGPGMFLAPRILEAADADKDSRLSPEEAAKAAERFVRDADKDKKGSLDVGCAPGCDQPADRPAAGLR